MVAKDQYGTPITNIASTSFSSQNGSVATVGNDGTVSAAGAGVAQVTASVTAGGVTKSGATTVTVKVAPTAATVRAPDFTFLPDIVDISVGGNVTWTIGAIHHNVTFDSPAAPASIDELRNASASRTFPAKGIFDYVCGFHAAMTGTVRVH
ncbi:MAG: plastocyanin/azurin family copper-binding protein [Gemmatimonadaceae bacterium]